MCTYPLSNRMPRWLCPVGLSHSIFTINKGANHAQYNPKRKSKTRYYLRPEPQGPEKQSAHSALAQAHGDNHQST